MTNPWIVSLSALFIWWFSTGAILWRVKTADNAGGTAHVMSVFLGLPLVLGGFLGLHATLNDASVQGVYVAFLSSLAIWGWIELAFLSGVITGPNTKALPPGTSGWDRFWCGVGTVAWHELLLAAALLVIARVSAEQPNPFGLYTFGVLFLARISAKLNLFFGVPRIHTEFLPRPLAHLTSHFRHAAMNRVFPVSVTLLTLAAGGWMDRASHATGGMFVGYVLLTALTLLALLEHWFMVLPLPDEKLFRWLLPAPKHPSDTPLTVRK
ncbi:MAG: putative photosynthetic complex assembly protein PuhE [Pseudomonadota bacterium]